MWPERYRNLVAGGIDAKGWDPHFAPENPKKRAEIVNIGFVLNVIEDLDERKQALERMETDKGSVRCSYGAKFGINRERQAIQGWLFDPS